MLKHYHNQSCRLHNCRKKRVRYILFRATKVKGEDERKEGKDQGAPSAQTKQRKGAEVIIKRSKKKVAEEGAINGCQGDQVGGEEEISSEGEGCSSKDIV